MGLISNTSGGDTFYQDVRLRRITRFRNVNVPVDGFDTDRDSFRSASYFESGIVLNSPAFTTYYIKVDPCNYLRHEMGIKL